jgi:uncharacterized protein (DUF1810 family)
MRASNSTQPDDPFDLKRFLSAQEGVYEQALAEIKSGHKRSHWMWYIFPQIDGLGFSPMSKRYAIKSLAEARQYLGHPTLGSRLVECTQALLAVERHSAADVFGYPDDIKLKSCMTLFTQVSGPGSVFETLLNKYFLGQQDEQTLRILGELSADKR